jgi:SH3-like domain-containing protein
MGFHQLRSDSIVLLYRRLLVGLMAGWWICFPVGTEYMPRADANEARVTIQGTGQPLPRFMTLKSDKVHMRTGPGMKYPILYVYQKDGMPLRVVREFDVWREVVDLDGERGWMHSSTLSLKRMAMITASGVNVMESDAASAPVIALAEKGAVVELMVCGADWCRIESGRIRGWIQKRYLWGVFSDEVF